MVHVDSILNFSFFCTPFSDFELNDSDSYDEATVPVLITVANKRRVFEIEICSQKSDALTTRKLIIEQLKLYFSGFYFWLTHIFRAQNQSMPRQKIDIDWRLSSFEIGVCDSLGVRISLMLLHAPSYRTIFVFLHRMFLVAIEYLIIVSLSAVHSYTNNQCIYHKFALGF